MYKVYCDEHLIFDDHLESVKILNPKVSLELNAVSSFTFTIYPDHPYFDELQKLKSVIRVFQQGVQIFKGRIISDDNGFYNEKKVTCESDLAFLLDSIQRPYSFAGTPEDLFRQLITAHNSQVESGKQFTVGTVTVTDPNDYINRSDETYQNTFDAIKSKLIDGLGGYLNIRESNGVTYIDYLEDFDLLSTQTIEFGKNLLDFTKKIDASNIFTVIVPIGSQMTDDDGNPLGKLTIKSVNSGKDYLEHSEGISLYGKIVKMVEWSDVTDATNLKNKGQQLLNNSVLLSNSIELTAADLGAIDQDISSFHIGTKVRIISKPHDVNALFLVNKLSIDLVHPSNDKLKLGTTYQSMTEKQKASLKTLNSQLVEKIESVQSDTIQVVTKQTQSSIQSSSDEILQTVSEGYYTKDEIPELISSQTSELRQTVDGWEQNWTTFQTVYEGDKNNTDVRFEEIQKYIRYIDGKIILGEVGNELELRIANDRLSFYQNNSEVAYFSNNKLFVTDGEYTNSLQLGKFAFIPRENGNLSFKKVRN